MVRARRNKLRITKTFENKELKKEVDNIKKETQALSKQLHEASARANLKTEIENFPIKGIAEGFLSPNSSISKPDEQEPIRKVSVETQSDEKTPDNDWIFQLFENLQAQICNLHKKLER